ncbi:hypothetical protein CEXT_542901 [Caerostris extrusa]|uniref:Uncharacterized protein n=1 Tax=Caerostris extrusa TaxID=172846 RepID=A0AAV4NQ19_CAEEX|nr:hypothetical protein CEXT_542901 [Caerostris extrusa]
MGPSRIVDQFTATHCRKSARKNKKIEGKSNSDGRCPVPERMASRITKRSVGLTIQSKSKSIAQVWFRYPSKTTPKGGLHASLFDFQTVSFRCVLPRIQTPHLQTKCRLRGIFIFGRRGFLYGKRGLLSSIVLWVVGKGPG